MTEIDKCLDKAKGIACGEEWEKANSLLRGKTFKELEPSEELAGWLYWYAYNVNVIGERFKKGEKIILTSPEYTYYYARYVIKGRWKKGEEIILTSPRYWYAYNVNVIGERFKKGEEII